MGGIKVPDEIVRMAISANGEAGRGWLRSLPDVVERLCVRWGLALGPPYEGGAVAFAAPATRTNGDAAVLKVSFVDEETVHEGDALALWDGDGAVRLLDADPALGALLIERLVPGTSLEDHPDRDQAIWIGCRLLRRLWRPVPSGHPFLPVPQLALRWAEDLPQRFERHGRPFERTLLDAAVDWCREFANPAEGAVLANRDFHLGNVLAAEREPWLLIDPKPLAGERAFDTGHLLRTLLPDEPDAAATQSMVSRLAAELDVDPSRIRGWGLVRSVEDALWGLATGYDEGIRSNVDRARLLAP